MPVPLAIRRQELVLRFVVHQRAEVLAVHGDLGIEPPLRAGGVAPLSHMVQDQARAILVRLVHGGQILVGVCLVLLRGIPVLLDSEVVHVSDLFRGEPVGCGELEIAVLGRSDVALLQVMHRQTGSGPVRHGPHSAGRLRLGLLDGVRGRVGRDLAGGILRVLVVGETVGDGRIDRLEAGLAGLSRGDRPADAEGRAGECGADVMLHSMRVRVVLVLVRDAGPAVRAEPGKMCVGAHVRAVEAADEFDALVVSAGAAVKVGESGHTTQSLRRGTVIQQEVDGHIHVRTGRGMQVPLAIRCHELTCRWDINQRAEVLAVHGDPGVEPPLRAGGVAPLSHMVQDQVRALPVRLVHGGQNTGVCLVLLRGIPVRFDGEAVHVSDLVRGKTINCGELEIAVLRGGDVALLQIMHRQTGSGLVSRESDTARGLGLGGLGGVLLAAFVRRNRTCGIRRVLVVGERICGQVRHVHADRDRTPRIIDRMVHLFKGDLEPGWLRCADYGRAFRIRIVSKGCVLASGTSGQCHVRGAIAGVRFRIRLVRIGITNHAELIQHLVGFDVGLFVGLPVVDDVTAHRLSITESELEILQYVHARGGLIGDGRNVGKHDRRQRIRTIALNVVEGESGVTREPVRRDQPAPLVAGEVLRGQRRVVGMRDGRVRVDMTAGHVDAHRYRFAGPAQWKVRPVNPAEFVRVWSGGAFTGLPAFEDGAAGRVVRHRLHVSGGLRFGGLGGVLLAALVRRNLTGRIGRILVISKLVRLGEHDVVDEVAARGVASLGALERESGHGRGGDVHAGVRLPFGLAALGRNGLGRHAGPVAAAIGRGAGGVLRCLLAWTAYRDLHGVDVGCVLARVLQAPPVHDARRGGDVLVDVFVRGFGDDLRETVHFLAVVVRLVADLHAMLELLVRVRLLVGTQSLLAAVPAEFGPVPVGDRHELASVIHVEAAPAGRRIHVAAVLAVRAGRIVERAVDDMVRQA